jgi:hypothetical protein
MGYEQAAAQLEVVDEPQAEPKESLAAALRALEGGQSIDDTDHEQGEDEGRRRRRSRSRARTISIRRLSKTELLRGR